MAIEGGEGIIRGTQLNQLEEELAQFPPELVRAVQLGMEVEDFMANSPIGKFLYNRAMTQISEATEGLLANPDIKSDLAKDDHDRARIANLFLEWLNEALAEAKGAQASLEEEYEQEEQQVSY